MTTEAPATTHWAFTQQTPEEIDAVRALLSDGGYFPAEARMAYLGLIDPPRGPRRSMHQDGRRFRALVLNTAEGTSRDIVVSPGAGGIVSVTDLDTAAEGELPVLEEEFEVVEAVLAQDEQWKAILHRRGLPVEEVRVAPLSAGVFEYPDEAGRRILRGLAFHQKRPQDSPWARPVDGLVAYVDVTHRVVDQILDLEDVPMPPEHGNFTDPELTGPVRTTQKPISITQPGRPLVHRDGGQPRRMGEVVTGYWFRHA